VLPKYDIVGSIPITRSDNIFPTQPARENVHGRVIPVKPENAYLMKLHDAITGYKIERLADGYSPQTIDVHSRFLSKLETYLQNPDIESITSVQLSKFMGYLRNDYVPKRRSGDTSPLLPASIDGAWKSIRSFFKWSADGLSLPRPDLKLHRAPFQSALVHDIPEADIKKLLKACEGIPQTKRDKTVILMLLDTGLRVGELTRLKREDVDLVTGEILVIPFRSGKKSRGRVVQIGKAAKRAAWQYLTTLPDMKVTDSMFDMSIIAVRLMLRRMAKRAGITDIHPHRFRHTFAINYLRNGGDVFTLQRLLGHSSMDMVERYLDIVKSDVANAHRIASPADHWKL